MLFKDQLFVSNSEFSPVPFKVFDKHTFAPVEANADDYVVEVPQEPEVEEEKEQQQVVPPVAIKCGGC